MCLNGTSSVTRIAAFPAENLCASRQPHNRHSLQPDQVDQISAKSEEAEHQSQTPAMMKPMQKPSHVDEAAFCQARRGHLAFS